MTLAPKLQDAINRLSIVDVVLRSITASLAPGVHPGLSHAFSEIAFQSMRPWCKAIQAFDAGEGRDRRRVSFLIEAGLRALDAAALTAQKPTPEEMEEKVLAVVECEFLVYYDELAAEVPLDQESLELFSQANVPFNVWPYWREVVQSACSRMGLPRVVLPPHRLIRSPQQSLPLQSAPSDKPDREARA